MEKTGSNSLKPCEVYLEIGKKKVIAGAMDWPGWCRGGKDEAAALEALFEYAARYARVAKLAGMEFAIPGHLNQLRVVERLAGTSTSDYGVPACEPTADALPVDDLTLERFERLLRACWQVLDETAGLAVGKSLRLGPRGGGRDLEGILQHVVGAEGSYCGSMGSKEKIDPSLPFLQQIDQERQAILAALADSAHGKLETHGPRGGKRWSPRYAARRIAWHVLDHAWEIEDRIR